MRFLNYSALTVMFTLTCGLTCVAQSSHVVLATKQPHGIGPKTSAPASAAQSAPLAGTAPNANATSGAAANNPPPNNGIQYKGGPVMNNPKGTNVYFIWYGN